MERSREGVERNQVDLAPKPLEKSREPAGVLVRVVLPAEKNVLDRDPPPGREGVGAERREEAGRSATSG